MSQSTVQFGGTVVSPIIKQNNNTVNNKTGTTFNINSQNSTGTTSTGGTLALASGTGTTASGNVTISVGGSLAATYSPTGLAWTANAVSFVPGANNPTISQQTQTSNIATNLLNITAQAPFASATGTNANAGFISLNIPAPVGAGAHGGTVFVDSGNTVLTVKGDVSGNGTMTLAGVAALTTGTSLVIGGSGKSIGFYAATPVVQATRAGQLTDSTGGTPSTTLASFTGSVYATDSPTIKNTISSLAAQVNKLELIIHNLGLSA